MSLVLHLMPDENTLIKFLIVKYQTPTPFVIYTDLESLLHAIDTQCEKTHRSHHHEPCAAAAIVISKYADVKNRTFINSGEDALNNFLEWLIEQEKIILNDLQNTCLMNTLSIEENDRYLNNTLCHICKRIYQPFIDSDPNFRKVRDTIISQENS